MAAKKSSTLTIKTPGIIDLHFHGAWGIDLMNPSLERKDFQTLLNRLYSSGIVAFCPTTLSYDWHALLKTCQQLGQWIREAQASPKKDSALPIGIHLEGPYLNPEASGAHPKRYLRVPTLEDWDLLWSASLNTLQVITVAPELIKTTELKKFTNWANKRNITLSIGHTCATTLQAEAAFKAGFRTVTHLWNAMRYHHREAGTWGALQTNQACAELIPDQIHLSLEWLNFSIKTLRNRAYFVSDCVPAAELKPGKVTTFGNLKITSQREVTKTKLATFSSRLVASKNTPLTGGGQLLTRSINNWIASLKMGSIAANNKSNTKMALQEELSCLVHYTPLKVLTLSPDLVKKIPKITKTWPIAP